MSITKIIPNWPAPANIVAFTTTRAAGNLAGHVGDNPQTVTENRARLIQDNLLPSDPFWLNQTHSTKVLTLDKNTKRPLEDADGSFTRLPNTVCAVLTADCLPILLCDRSGQEVAALHAGWRGILGDIITPGVKCFSCPPKEILAWFGPAIGPKAFEVGPEVLEAFVAAYPQNKEAFLPSPKPGHFLLDIYALARQYLNRLGVTQIYGGDQSTYSDPEHFYSYRRENQTGRIATIIWRT